MTFSLKTKMKIGSSRMLITTLKIIPIIDSVAAPSPRTVSDRVKLVMTKGLPTVKIIMKFLV